MYFDDRPITFVYSIHVKMRLTEVLIHVLYTHGETLVVGGAFESDDEFF